MNDIIWPVALLKYLQWKEFTLFKHNQLFLFQIEISDIKFMHPTSEEVLMKPSFFGLSFYFSNFRVRAKSVMHLVKYLNYTGTSSKRPTSGNKLRLLLLNCWEKHSSYGQSFERADKTSSQSLIASRKT